MHEFSYVQVVYVGVGLVYKIVPEREKLHSIWNGTKTRAAGL